MACFLLTLGRYSLRRECFEETRRRVGDEWVRDPRRPDAREFWSWRDGDLSVGDDDFSSRRDDGGELRLYLLVGDF
jgi:hypothetical protein